MKLLTITTIALLLAAQTAFSQTASEKFSEQKLRDHVEWLASDKRKGRGTGSKEERKSAAYLAKQIMLASRDVARGTPLAWDLVAGNPGDNREPAAAGAGPFTTDTREA